MAKSATKSGRVYTGIGGWTFEPWRGVFYPEGLAHAKELQYAASRLTSIEINGTFYRTQSPATYRKWASEVPDGFVFSVKGLRYVTNRGVLAEAGESINRFLGSGVLELGDHLGPLLWQMAPFKKFDEADFGKFLELLPHEVGKQKLRHVVEVRHDSFKTPAFVALLRKFNVGIVYSEHETYPEIADLTVRLRLCAAAEGRRQPQDRLSAETARCAGRSASSYGPRAASRTTCRTSTRNPRRRYRATCLPT